MKITLTKQETDALMNRMKVVQDAAGKLEMFKESQLYYVSVLAKKYNQKNKIVSFDINTGELEFEEDKPVPEPETIKGKK